VPISELQKYGDQLLKVGYMTQQQVKPASFRHNRSSSLDQMRSDFDRVCELTQRMSLDEPQQQQYYQKHYYHPQQRNHQQVRRMTSTNSLNSTTSLNSNSRLSTSSSSSCSGSNQYYEQPRHSRSSVNLHQGFWKPSSPTPQQQDRRLSLTSIHAPPFIPNSELQQQFYYPIGIPTPPPSASPIHYQQSQAQPNTTTYPSMFL
jgi:hypothetical protein